MLTLATFVYLGAMYTGENYICDITPSVYPHQASGVVPAVVIAYFSTLY